MCSWYGVAKVGYYDGLLVTVSSSTGSVVSTNRIGVVPLYNIINFKDVAVDSTGGIWVAGTTDSSTYFTKPSLGHADFILQKFSPSGESLFVSRVGSHSRDTADYLALDSSDNMYTVGDTLSGPYNGEVGLGRSDILVTKHSSAGVKLWARVYGGSNWDGTGGISVNSQYNRVYVTGYTQARRI